MSDAFELEICQGKYRYRYEAGKQEVWRNGDIWPTMNEKLIGDKFVFSLAVELDEALKERDALRADKATLQQMTYSLKDRLEVAEEDSAHHKALAESALRVAKEWERKCDSLRAKVESMEQQVPICRAEDLKHAESLLPTLGLKPENPLYALPGAQEQEPTRDWWDCLIADISAIDCMYRGSPTYAHDAYWMRDRVVRMLKKRRDALPGAQTQPAPSVPTALLVAVADLTAQMEIVSRVGFVDTPNDKDSCAAFCVAEGTWLEFTRAVESLASAFAVTVAEQVPAEGEQK